MQEGVKRTSLGKMFCFVVQNTSKIPQKRMKQRKKETETLQVYRDWKSSYNQITYLKDNQGKIKQKWVDEICE